ncbi:MBL fold metallo-hydrolase [bacterium]|nr:MBL fold metallo-hydrolase [bacterium]
MALIGLRRPENAPGDFFVDSTCIDCDLCRQIAPQVFVAGGDQAIVHAQPADEESEFAALKALVTCPTASIGDLGHRSAKKAVNAYPEKIEGEVYFCGFASESSYGASSYLIVRPDGNVLVDSPRFAKPLVRNIEALGGIRHIFLTHRDDVADQDLWARHFGASRIMHHDDAGRLRSQIEHLIAGNDAVSFRDDLLIIPTPGHTKGHMVLLYRNRFMFTGDHLWWSPNYNSLHASRGVCWYSWPNQVDSIKRLQNFSFEWVLPGHGRRLNAPAEKMQAYLAECIHRLSRN